MAARSFIIGLNSLKLLSPINSKLLPNCLRYNTKYRKNIFGIYATCQLSTFSGENDDGSKGQKKIPSNRTRIDSGPKITLIGTDSSLLITSLQEAQRISRRRDLKLVKMVDFDTKTERAIYKLMTGKEYFEEDKKQRLLKSAKKEASSKGEKMVTLSYRISTHDVQSRINNIYKWLAKNYEVKVIINGESTSTASAEKVFGFIDEAMKDQGRITQKRQKGNDIKFQIIPPKKETKKQETSDAAEPQIIIEESKKE